MISCTEFIPAYSELFTYLEEKYGRDEVDSFWTYLFEPDGKGIPLINHVQKEGIRGCYSYWSKSLNEEAADFTMCVNEKRGYFMINMHRCPSKGRLLELEKEIGIKPYRDYCLHCDHYRAAIERVGLKYIYNFNGVDKASCSLLIYDPKVFDGRVIIDEDTEKMDKKASDNEYFHKDFHSSMNMGIEYLGSKYGIDAVREYLICFTNNVYQDIIKQMNESGGLRVLEAHILDTYKKEKAFDAVKTELSPDMNELIVNLNYCPAVKHLRNTGREVSKWYPYTTKIVMKTLADSTGYSFVMENYDNETGKATYKFFK